MNLKFYFLLSLAVFCASCSHRPTKQDAPVISSTESPPVPQQPSQALDRQMALKKISELAQLPAFENQLIKAGPEISIKLPTSKPRVNRDEEWHLSYVEIFSKRPETVDQIAITTMTCKAIWDVPHQYEIRMRLLEQIKSVSQALWGQGFELDSDRYFKELGPYSSKPVQVPIREQFKPVLKMRLSRGIYKCDGAGGFGFRYDFFLH